MADPADSSGADRFASAAASAAKTTYRWTGTGIGLARDGTVYGYQMAKGAVQRLAASSEQTEKIKSEESGSNNGSSWQTALETVGSVGSKTYQLAGAGAKHAMDGTVYCYEKSKDAIVGLVPSGKKLDETNKSPSLGRVAGTTVAIAGAGSTSYLWLTAISSHAAKEAFRASCIRNALCAMTSLSLPIQRSTAVYIGTRLNNYILQGIVPGIFTAWAVYDTYRLGKWAYNWYYYPTEDMIELIPISNQPNHRSKL